MERAHAKGSRRENDGGEGGRRMVEMDKKKSERSSLVK